MVENFQNERIFIPDPQNEEQILFPGVDPINTEWYHNRLVIEGFVEGHPGEIFNINDVINDSPWLTPDTCREVLRKLNLVECLTVSHKTAKYLSKAPELTPTFTPEVDGDSIGKQARADFHELVSQRSQNIRKRIKVIRKF